MKSRVHPSYKTKYRVKNWASYDYAADGDKVDEALRDLAGLEIASVVSSTAHHHVDFKVAESASCAKSRPTRNVNDSGTDRY